MLLNYRSSSHTPTHAGQTQSAHWSNSCTEVKFLLCTRSNPLILEARSNPVWSNSSPNEPCCYTSSRCAQPDITYIVGAGSSNPRVLKSQCTRVLKSHSVHSVLLHLLQKERRLHTACANKPTVAVHGCANMPIVTRHQNLRYACNALDVHTVLNDRLAFSHFFSHFSRFTFCLSLPLCAFALRFCFALLLCAFALRFCFALLRFALLHFVLLRFALCTLRFTLCASHFALCADTAIALFPFGEPGRHICQPASF